MLEWLSSFIDSVWNLLIKFFLWLVNAVLSFIDPLLMSIAEKLPNLNMETATFFKWSSFANTWIPLGYGLTLVGCYFVFIGSILLVKWLLGLIPTLN